MLLRIIKRIIVSSTAFLVWLYFVDFPSYFVFGGIVATISMALEFKLTRQMFLSKKIKNPTRFTLLFRAALFIIDTLIWPYQILFNVSKHRMAYARTAQNQVN